MARGKGTQLATTDGATNGELANKPTITKSAATDMVRQLAASMYRDAQREVKAKRDRVVAQVGSVDRVDDSVIADAERLMTRVALISRTKADRYASSGNAALESIVKKLGGVVGELRAFMLTNASIGLFEQIDENDYRAQVYGSRDVDPTRYAGPKVRERAAQLLENYTIVDEPKPARKKKGGKQVQECRVCGCTDKQGCEDGCAWVEDDLCSSCDDKICGECGATLNAAGVCEFCAVFEDEDGGEEGDD